VELGLRRSSSTIEDGFLALPRRQRSDDSAAAAAGTAPTSWQRSRSGVTECLHPSIVLRSRPSPAKYPPTVRIGQPVQLFYPRSSRLSSNDCRFPTPLNHRFSSSTWHTCQVEIELVAVIRQDNVQSRGAENTEGTSCRSRAIGIDVIGTGKCLVDNCAVGAQGSCALYNVTGAVSCQTADCRIVSRHCRRPDDVSTPSR